MSYTYEELREMAYQFLGNCGEFTLDEHDRFEQASLTSVNEVLFMAMRLLAEAALELQRIADSEEGRP